MGEGLFFSSRGGASFLSWWAWGTSVLMGDSEENYRIVGGACLPPLCETRVTPMKSDLNLAHAILKVFNYWLVKLEMDRAMKYLNNQFKKLSYWKSLKFHSSTRSVKMQVWIWLQIWGSFWLLCGHLNCCYILISYFFPTYKVGVNFAPIINRINYLSENIL